MDRLKNLLPLSLRAHIADLRGRGVYSQYADQCQCIFIHIPKAAGTSVALTLFGQESRHIPWFEYQRANPVKFKRYFKFSFVRNPWARLVSSYFYLQRGGMNSQDSAWAMKYLSPYPDFPSFVRFGLNDENIRNWVHFLAQHYFICDALGKLKVDFVGRVENLEADFAYVAKRLGCDKKPVQVNAGDNRHYSTYYDEEMQWIVQRAYARDIELFGYVFEDRSDR